MEMLPAILSAEGLQQFAALELQAVSAVTDRFCAMPGSAYERYGEQAREECRGDIAFHLECLRPVLEFGLVAPMVDYLCWLGLVLAVRKFPPDHAIRALDWLEEFFHERMNATDYAVIRNAIHAAKAGFLLARGATLFARKSQVAWPEAALFEIALLAGHYLEAMEIVDDCLEGGRSLVEVEAGVIAPTLYAIGEKWQANQVNVAQEHLATAITQTVMTTGLLRAKPVVMSGHRALLACVEGNHHSIGLRMVADALQLGGWEVQYLGANVPTAAIMAQVRDWEPHLLGLSFSFAQQLRTGKDIIAQLYESAGNNRPAVIVGGLAVNRYNGLAGMLGADLLGADAPAALRYAKRLARGFPEV